MLLEKDLQIAKDGRELDRIMECSDALDTFSGAGGIMNRPTGNGEALERLKEMCGGKLGESCDDIIANDNVYINQTNRCVYAYKALKNALSNEERKLLFAYDEELAKQDLIKTELIIRHVLCKSAT